MSGRDERGRFLKGVNPPGVRFGEGQVNQGKHSNFDRGKVDEILDLIADGKTIEAACAVVGIRSGTFKSWIARNHEQLEADYWIAMRARMIGELDRTIELTDEVLGETNTATVFAAKNASDARWRVLSRLLRQLHPEAHVQVDHRDVSVHIYLPGKQNSGDRDQVIEGRPRELIEDRSGDDEDEDEE